MSFAGLLRQEVTIYPKTGYGADGRSTAGTGVTVKARIQETTKRKLLPTGTLITIDAIVYVPASTTVATDDKLVYGSNSYKVFGKYSAIGGAGQTHHIKLELIKWQQT